MSGETTVIGVLRRFLPDFLAGKPVLTAAQGRALWAIQNCRTAALGGHAYLCPDCGARHFSYHSCNHRSCPQCGAADTAAWVRRELERRVGAPYFMVTFTLPEELRAIFASSSEPDALRAFFHASAQALRDVLANPRWLGAAKSGFTQVLHTWDQRLRFHPHIHTIVPGAGEAASGDIVQVKNPGFLVPQPVLRTRFRTLMREAARSLPGAPDPDHPVWNRDWGVDIRPFGDGGNAIRYLGRYVCRTAISDARILGVDDHGKVRFRWTDRAQGNVRRVEAIPGVDFVRRYLRHVLPKRLRAVRHCGFHHPAARRRRQRIAFHTGRPLVLDGASAGPPAEKPRARTPACPGCGHPMASLGRIAPPWRQANPVPSRARAPPLAC